MAWGIRGVLAGLAWSSMAQANVVGADTQNFNPITSGLDFVTVQSSETLKPGIFNFGFFLNYAVNSLPNYEDVNTQSRTNFADSLTSADLNFGVGLMPNWDFGMSIPLVLNQRVDSDISTFRGEYEETGMTEIRLNTKYRFSGDDSEGMALVGSVNFNQIQDNPFAGVNAGPTLNLEFVADKTIGRYAVGGNIGYRKRNPGEQVANIPVEPLKDQLIASAAVSYLLEDYDIKVIGELFGSFPAQRSVTASDRDLSTLEALLGMKMDLRQDFSWHAGAGTEVIHGTASPDWRIYTGINWNMGPLFSKPKEVITNRRLEEGADPFAGEPEANESFVARDILFKFNSDELQPEFLQVLKRFADYVKQPPGFKELIVEGHTDSIGSAEYNQSLSVRRAMSVKKALVRLGLSDNKVRAEGRGEDQPIADNGNFQGRAQNRRVEFKITR